MTDGGLQNILHMTDIIKDKKEENTVSCGVMCLQIPSHEKQYITHCEFSGT